MEKVVPWNALLGQIEPNYPHLGRAMETMLRIHRL
jgi:hypothetical protein